MSKINMGATQNVATLEMPGRTCDVIRFGCRLRIVNQQNDRSIDKRGYRDLNEIMDAYPDARVSRT